MGKHRERLNMTVEVDADELVDQLASRNEGVASFVIALDKATADWSVTLELCDYFAKARVEYAKEHAADYPHGCSEKECEDCYPAASPSRDSVPGTGKP